MRAGGARRPDQNGGKRRILVTREARVRVRVCRPDDGHRDKADTEDTECIMTASGAQTWAAGRTCVVAHKETPLASSQASAAILAAAPTSPAAAKCA